MISKSKILDSEAALKDFSSRIKQDMMDHVRKHQNDFASDIETVLSEINELGEKELLALYIEGHSYDEDAIDYLVQAQDDKLPF